VPVDHGVELSGSVDRCARERSRERRGVAPELLLERPAGEVVLVDGDDRGPALIGASHP